MTEIQTRNVEKFHFRDYLSRAEQCLELAEAAQDKAHWDACAINAIQSAISASDALATFKLGVRNSSQRHDEAVKLFKRIDPQDAAIQENASRFARIVTEKNASAYEERPVSPKEARYLLTESRRFVDFVKSKLPK